MAKLAVSELSDRLGVPVKIGQIDIDWFNRLVLEDVYLADKSGDVLLQVNYVGAGFDIFPLLKGKLVFSTARLFGWELNLKKATPSDKLNLQFVIDAFAKKDTTRRKTNVDLRFNSILIHQGKFRFDVQNAPQTPDVFNAEHIELKDISARITVKALNKDSINATVNRFSFKEISGLNLDKLTLSVKGNRDSLALKDLHLQLANSNLHISNASIVTDSIHNLQELMDKAPVHLNINTSQIGLRDLSPFVPAFRNFSEPIQLSALASGTINDIHLQSLYTEYSDKIVLYGKANIKGITQPQNAYIFGKISKMNISTEGVAGLAANFLGREIQLPQPLIQLGTINFDGEITGFIGDLVAVGKFTHKIGTIKTDLIFKKNENKNIAAHLKGELSTSSIDVGQILPEGSPLSNFQLNVNMDMRRPVNGPVSTNVNANIETLKFKGYQYKNILLSGNFSGSSFDGKVEMDDPNGQLYAEGLFKTEGANSVFNFTSHLAHLRPDSLHLTRKYDEPEISMSMTADFSGNDIDNINGSIRLKDLTFKTRPSTFKLDQMDIIARGTAAERQLIIQSDIINGEIAGLYSFNTIIPSLKKTFNNYIPALINTDTKNLRYKENNFNLSLTIDNTESLSNTLKLPFTVLSQSKILGYYNNIYDRFYLEADFPQYLIGKGLYEKGQLTFQNPNEEVKLHLSTDNFGKKGTCNTIGVHLVAKENKVDTKISWKNDKKRIFKAELGASAFFRQEEQENGKSKLTTLINIKHSPLILNDSAWIIMPAKISIVDNVINVRDFSVKNNSEYLNIDGKISNNLSDTLFVDLKDVELKYIFDILNIPVLQFEGKTTGKANASDLFKQRILNADLKIKDFGFNQTKFGNLDLIGKWDDVKKSIFLDGDIYQLDSTGTNRINYTKAIGDIIPVGDKAGLSLKFDATDINLAFLHPFIGGVVDNFQGRGFGKIHLYGPFKQLNVEGDAFVKDGGLGINYLNTYYTFSDSLHLTPNLIQAKNVTVYDKFRNKANVNLNLHHKHFKDLAFNIGMNVNNALVYNADKKQNPLISGTVFASGVANISGNNKVIDFNINMKSEPNSTITFDFMNNNSASDYNFITFIDKKKLNTEVQVSGTDSIKHVLFDRSSETGAEMRMLFTLNITPDAHINLIMDPTAGDKIAGNCEGVLRVDYGTKSDLKMHGDVEIVEGLYNFSLQQLIHKNFKIRNGSIIHFSGDPLEAQMDLNAIYSLTANIQDLDASFATESSKRNVPVNCVLKLKDKLRRPQVDFDIELPSSNKELESQVKSMLDTPDRIARQIVYLLVLNKFYTPDKSINPYASDEFSAVASSAISSQISSLMNTITDKVQFGTNIRTSQDGIEDTEVEMLLSSQLLNNRLIFNGNFGYKNNPNQKNAFVGEFDLEYLLTPSGDIRLKAYNHSNDMYMYLKEALTTQGVGVMYKKDFNRFSDIFFRRRKKQKTSQSYLIPENSNFSITADSKK